MDRKVSKISRRAWLLAKQNHIDVSNIVPTGPGGRIIERDIFRELEKVYLAKNAETSVDEIDINPIESSEELAVSSEMENEKSVSDVAEISAEDSAEPVEIAETVEEPISEAEEVTEEVSEVTEPIEIAEIVEEPISETEEVIEEVSEVTEPIEIAEPAEEPISETEEVTEEVAEVTENIEVAEPVEETISEAEEVTEEVAEVTENIEVAEIAEETISEAEEVTEEVAEVTETIEIAEPAEEPISETEEETAAIAEIECVETRTEQTAIVAVPAKTITKEVDQKANDPKESETEKEKTNSYGTEVYRHTDVIIPRTETSPNGTPITLTMSFDAGAVVKLHNMIKENGETMGLPHITINDMILFATARLLKKNKALNAHFLGDKIRYFEGAHLGFAVDTDHGIESLTVFDADHLSLSSLAKITGALIRGAKAGNVSPEKNKLCASFTVSDLGALGVEFFTPVLKGPQTGILGVCALQRRLKEVNGKDVAYSCIPLSLTFDPRALDMTSASGFLRDLCASLENFELLLIK